MGCVVNTMPLQFYPQGRNLVPIVLGAGWAPWPVWTGADSLTSTRIQCQDHPAHSESLCHLYYPGPLCQTTCSMLFVGDEKQAEAVNNTINLSFTL